MWPSSFFPLRVFARTYFGRRALVAIGGGYFPNSFWPNRFYPKSFFAKTYIGAYAGGYFSGIWPSSYFCPAFWPHAGFSDLLVGQMLVAQDAADLHVSWQGPLPAGCVYQLYANRVLLWTGPGRSATIPVPQTFSGINVGVVPIALEHVSFGPYLPGPLGGGDRAELNWQGGTYLDPDIQGFNVYSGLTPGGTVSYAKAVATVPAYPGGTPQDGFGLGGFGEGGFGLSASDYQWISGRLATGTWHFAVKPFDSAGNEGSAATVSVAIVSAPLPPAPNAKGERLTYTYDHTSHTATLNWLASPG